jgi:cytochrome b561
MTRYTRLAVALHWLIAAVVVAQVTWGWLMQEIPKTPPGLRADAFNAHKSIGLCIFALMLVRLGWRLAHPPPPPLPRIARWQTRAAKLTHSALYAALFVMPIAGYLGSVFSGYPVKWFGITLPGWYPKAPLLKAWMSDVHLFTSVVLVSLVALHVAAALHHAFRGDGVMARMTFGGSNAGKRLNARAAAPLRAPVRFPRA